MIPLVVVLAVVAFLLIYTALKGKDQGFNPFKVAADFIGGAIGGATS